jgi:hypothetical protein
MIGTGKGRNQLVTYPYRSWFDLSGSRHHEGAIVAIKFTISYMLLIATAQPTKYLYVQLTYIGFVKNLSHVDLGVPHFVDNYKSTALRCAVISHKLWNGLIQFSCLYLR